VVEGEAAGRGNARVGGEHAGGFDRALAGGGCEDDRFAFGAEGRGAGDDGDAERLEEVGEERLEVRIEAGEDARAGGSEGDRGAGKGQQRRVLEGEDAAGRPAAEDEAGGRRLAPGLDDIGRDEAVGGEAGDGGRLPAGADGDDDGIGGELAGAGDGQQPGLAEAGVAGDDLHAGATEGGFDPGGEGADEGAGAVVGAAELKGLAGGKDPGDGEFAGADEPLGGVEEDGGGDAGEVDAGAAGALGLDQGDRGAEAGGFEGGGDAGGAPADDGDIEAARGAHGRRSR
jgi:hypothetical protein